MIFGLVVHEILKMQADKTSELERVRQGVKACVVLFPLLGMTWVFGVLSITDAGLAFQYIFTILNSLQVLLLSIYYTVLPSFKGSLGKRLRFRMNTAVTHGTHILSEKNMFLGQISVQKLVYIATSFLA